MDMRIISVFLALLTLSAPASPFDAAMLVEWIRHGYIPPKAKK